MGLMVVERGMLTCTIYPFT